MTRRYTTRSYRRPAKPRTGTGTIRRWRSRRSTSSPLPIIAGGIVVCAFFLVCVVLVQRQSPQPSIASPTNLASDRDAPQRSGPPSAKTASSIVESPSSPTPASVPPPIKIDTSPTSSPRSTTATNASRPSFSSFATTATSSPRHEAGLGPFQTEAGTFTLPSTMPDLAEVTVDWCAPIGDAHVVKDLAPDIVLFFPYPTQTKTIEFAAQHIGLTSTYGFTTICVNFPKMGPKDGVPTDDAKRFYYYPESGSGALWKSAIDQVRARRGLAVRPVLVAGLSGGGSAAGLFADAYPELVAGVFNEAGRVFAIQPRFSGPVMLIHGHQDYVRPEQEQEEARRQRAGLPVSRLTYPPSWGSRGRSDIWRHGAEGPAREFLGAWLAAIADLRLGNGGVVSSMTTWTARSDTTPMPSRRSADIWNRVPKAARAVGSAGDTPVWYAQPGPGQDMGARVVLVDCGPTASQESMRDDVEQLSNRGLQALGVVGKPDSVVTALRQALRDPMLTAAADLPWYPVLLWGSRPAGMLSLQGHSPAAIVAAGPSLTLSLDALVQDASTSGLHLFVNDRPARVTMWKKRFATAHGIEFVTTDPPTHDLWHAQQMDMAGKFISLNLRTIGR